MNTSKEPENLYEEPPVPEIKPCPICGKTPSVYCAGCSMLGSGASTGFLELPVHRLRLSQASFRIERQLL